MQTRMSRAMLAISATMAISVLAELPVAAKVALVSLAELTEQAEFVGIVRVDRMRLRIPLLRRPHATATILDRGKGRPQGEVTFLSAPTWTCDISTATKGEEAIVFVADGRLLHSGLGRMPMFLRAGQRLAAVWSEVMLPADIVVEQAPQPQQGFIRAIAVDALRSAVATVRLAHSNPK